MGYKILGISLSHNSSICVLDEGEIIFFLEEDRLSREKHDAHPLCLISYIASLFKINEIAISGLSGFYNMPYYFKPLELFLIKIFPNIPINFKYLNDHHLAHSTSAFYNSGFSKALSIIIDGMGEQDEQNKGWETETIQIIEYPLKVQNIYKSYITEKYTKYSNKEVFSPLVSLSRVYEGVTDYLNFKWDEPGKVMGLSSYGQLDSTIPDLYINGKGNPDIILNQNLYCKINLPPISNKWHKDPFKVTDFEKNLAYKVQQESQQAVGDLIEKGLKETGLKQVCCSGGYFLNCVANYYLKKRFPDIDFYFEPISSDAGTSIGIAKLVWYKKTQDRMIKSQKTLYYGPKYSKEQLLEGIKKYLD
tara:strand:- start:72 stop:1157 length:1086 start_codon:yes stop_codon:yes gene_type:complete